MWYQILLRKYSLIYIDDIGVKSRLHEKQLTQTGKEIFKKDSLIICKRLSQEFVDCSSKNYNFIYYYAKENAIYGNKEVASICVQKAIESKKISVFQRFKIFLFGIYGKFRPTIRRVYYRLFRKMKTN